MPTLLERGVLSLLPHTCHSSFTPLALPCATYRVATIRILVVKGRTTSSVADERIVPYRDVYCVSLPWTRVGSEGRRWVRRHSSLPMYALPIQHRHPINRRPTLDVGSLIEPSRPCLPEPNPERANSPPAARMQRTPPAAGKWNGTQIDRIFPDTDAQGIWSATVSLRWMDDVRTPALPRRCRSQRRDSLL